MLRGCKWPSGVSWKKSPNRANPLRAFQYLEGIFDLELELDDIFFEINSIISTILIRVGHFPEALLMRARAESVLNLEEVI